MPVTREDIRNDDFVVQHSIKHCCDIILNRRNIVPTLQRCVALEIVVTNRLV